MPETNGERTVYCRLLRTKKMYIPALHTEGDPRDETETAAYWCLKTMAVVGPDGNLVRGNHCQAGRGCCEAEY
jgi:hypothetical protein